MEDKKIVRDAYTARLLELFKELVKKDAIAKKKNFADALGITSVFLNHLENRRGNFPQEDAKRYRAAQALNETYHANLDWVMRGVGNRCW